MLIFFRCIQSLPQAVTRTSLSCKGYWSSVRPSQARATKLLYLVLNRSEKEWKMGPREWSMAKAQFAVIFGDRFTRAMAG